MANEKVSKVIFGGQTLIDLTSDTVTADKLIQWKRNSEYTGFPGFLFDDGQAIAVSIPDNISKP